MKRILTIVSAASVLRIIFCGRTKLGTSTVPLFAVVAAAAVAAAVVAAAVVAGAGAAGAGAVVAGAGGGVGSCNPLPLINCEAADVVCEGVGSNIGGSWGLTSGVQDSVGVGGLTVTAVVEVAGSRGTGATWPEKENIDGN